MEENSMGLGKLIYKRTRALERAMRALPMREKTRMEIAFQIAEVSNEFEFMLKLLNRAERGRHITANNLKDLYGMSQHHWPGHLPALSKALLQALDQFEQRIEEGTVRMNAKRSQQRKKKGQALT
jgi:hypothetical protein